MKVLPDLPTSETAQLETNGFSLPQGIIGFKDYTRAELLHVPDHYPFLWMKLHGASESIHFIVIEPGGLIPDYELELFDDDADSLGLTDPAEAMVLNIVTLRQQNPLEAHANLVGPIVVNRRTRVGRQLVIGNYSRYSAHHPLISGATARATA